ncbi:MAG: hypothetical protein ACRDTQ_05420 [Micromonosporaceae bacterium]
MWFLVGLHVATYGGMASLSFPESITNTGALICAGLIIGAISTTRISPLGPTAAALALFGGAFLFLSGAADPLQLITVPGMEPREVSVVHWNGALLFLAAIMLMALFSRGRWRAAGPVPQGEAAPASAARHVWGVLVGLLVGAAAWPLFGLGQGISELGWDNAPQPMQIAQATALLVVGGAAIGLVAATRLSPTAPVTAGLVFGAGMAVLGWRRTSGELDPAALKEALPFQVLEVPAWYATAMPAYTGLALLITVALLTAVANGSRWRAAPKVETLDTFSDLERTDTDVLASGGSADATEPANASKTSEEPTESPDQPADDSAKQPAHAGATAGGDASRT